MQSQIRLTLHMILHLRLSVANGKLSRFFLQYLVHRQSSNKILLKTMEAEVS